MDLLKNFWDFLDNKRKNFFFIIISHHPDNLKICYKVFKVGNKKLVID